MIGFHVLQHLHFVCGHFSALGASEKGLAGGGDRGLEEWGGAEDKQIVGWKLNIINIFGSSSV